MWRASRTRTGVVAAVVAATILFAVIPAASAPARTWVTWLLFGALHVRFAMDGWVLWQRRGLTGAPRRIWRALTVAALMFCLGDAVQLAALSVTPWSATIATGVPTQTILVLSGTAIVLLAAVLEPLRLGSVKDSAKGWLDIGVVLIAVVAVAAVVTPVSEARDTATLLRMLVEGPFLFAVTTLALAKLVLVRDRPFTPTVGRLLGVAALGEALLSIVTINPDRAHNLSLVFGMALVSNALVTLASLLQRRSPPPPPPSPLRLSFSALPYAAIVTTNVVLVVLLLNRGLTRDTWIVLGATVVSTTFVLARQLVSITESSALLRQLRGALDERDRLTEQLRQLAYHDPLTGLANRALFDRALDEAVTTLRSGQTCTDLTVLMVDLDGFKEVNDTLGHAAGDEVLARVAERITTRVPDDALVARFGGDEYFVMLQEPAARAEQVAQAIVDTLARPFSVAATAVRISASVGLATADPGIRSGDELIRHADAAMYTAKARGKNRVEVAGGVSPAP